MNALAHLQKTQNLQYHHQVNLLDPTSVTMQSSFLIKSHATANFDGYYQMMKKRKVGITGSGSPIKEGGESPSPLQRGPTLRETSPLRKPD